MSNPQMPQMPLMQGTSWKENAVFVGVLLAGLPILGLALSKLGYGSSGSDQPKTSGSARRGKNKEDGLPVEQLMQLQASVQSMLKKATTFKKSGRFSEAKANLVACARMLEEIGDGQSLQTLAEILKEIIELCKELEQWKEVVGYVKSLFTIMERVGAPPETIPALLLSLGEAFHEAGNWEEALTWSQQCLVVYSKLGKPQGESFYIAHAIMGNALLQMEKYKEAEDFIKQYYSVVKEKKDLDLIVSESWATAISLYLRLLLHKGDVKGAQEEFQLRCKDDIPNKPLHSLMLKIARTVFYPAGHFDICLEIWEKMATNPMVHRYVQRLARLQIASLYFQRGDDVLAEEQLVLVRCSIENQSEYLGEKNKAPFPEAENLFSRYFRVKRAKLVWKLQEDNTSANHVIDLVSKPPFLKKLPVNSHIVVYFDRFRRDRLQDIKKFQELESQEEKTTFLKEMLSTKSDDFLVVEKTLAQSDVDQLLFRFISPNLEGTKKGPYDIQVVLYRDSTKSEVLDVLHAIRWCSDDVADASHREDLEQAREAKTQFKENFPISLQNVERAKAFQEELTEERWKNLGLEKADMVGLSKEDQEQALAKSMALLRASTVRYLVPSVMLEDILD